MLFRSPSSILRQSGHGASAQSGRPWPAQSRFPPSGREVEVEDPWPDLIRYALTVIAHSDIGPASVFGQPNLQQPARGHGLCPVKHHVEESLFQQVGVDPAQDGPRRRLALDGDAARLEFGGSQPQHAGDDRPQILILELELDWTGKVDQRLHDAIEAANFALDDVEMPQGVAAGVDLVPEQLQMDNDGVDGILHLVTDSRREAADRSHTPRNFELALNLADRFQIVEGQQRARELRSRDLESWMKVEGDFNAPAGFRGDLFLDDGHAAFKGVANDAAEPGIAVEDLADFRPKDVLPADVEEALNRAGNQDGASIAGERA
jgi:hypothetical protein